VGILGAIAYSFFTWLAEHREMTRALRSWQATLERSEKVILRAVQVLPVSVFSNFKLDKVRDRFQEAVDTMLGEVSPEEIDIQIATTALFTPVPGDVYLRLGNYFRFKSSLAKKEGHRDQERRDLFYAIRRYERAREAAEAEVGRHGRLVVGHALL